MSNFYKQSFVDNTAWDFYGGKKDKDRRFLILNPQHVQKVGVPLTTTLVIQPTNLLLKKDIQPKDHLESDSNAEFIHFATFNFRDAKLNLTLAKDEVERAVKIAIGRSLPLKDIYPNNDFYPFHQGRVFLIEMAQWVIVSPNRYNKVLEEVVCLNVNGKKIWSYSKTFLNNQKFENKFLPEDCLENCLKTFEKRIL
jgi:hypothetical protein